eukprot:12736389-Alexandrium_andersonii.AAC.1
MSAADRLGNEHADLAASAGADSVGPHRALTKWVLHNYAAAARVVKGVHAMFAGVLKEATRL